MKKFLIIIMMLCISNTVYAEKDGFKTEIGQIQMMLYFTGLDTSNLEGLEVMHRRLMRKMFPELIFYTENITLSVDTVLIRDKSSFLNEGVEWYFQYSSHTLSAVDLIDNVDKEFYVVNYIIDKKATKETPFFIMEVVHMIKEKGKIKIIDKKRLVEEEFILYGN